MNKHYKGFLTDLEKGYNGESISIPITSGPLTDSVSKLGHRVSLSKGNYILFGGMPGSGKTAIVDSMFLLNIYLWWRRNRENTTIKPYWIYRSMERNVKYKIAKWKAYLIYVEHGILLDVPTIFQWSNKQFELTEELYTLIKSYDEFFDEFFDYVDIKQGADNPTGVRNYGLKVAFQKGKYVKSTDKEVLINGEKVCEFRDTDYVVQYGRKVYYRDINIAGEEIRIFQYEIHYFPDDPDEIMFHITDHIGKEKTEQGFSDKGIIDKHAEYMGEFRDDLLWNPIDIQQFNRAIEDTYRKVKTDLDVSTADFKGSGDPYENADIVFGLLNPYKLKMPVYDGYDINRFVTNKGYNRFRGLKCLKNSYGIDDFKIGYAFLGENGFMRELPLSEHVTPDIYTKIMNAQLI